MTDNYENPLVVNARIEILDTPPTPATALRWVKGGAAGLLLADSGIPVFGIDEDRLTPVSGPMWNPEMIVGFFGSNRAACVGFDPGELGASVFVAESSAALRHLVAGRGVEAGAAQMRAAWSAAPSRAEWHGEGIVVAVQPLLGTPMFHEVQPVGLGKGRVQYIADTFLVPHALVYALAADLALRSYLRGLVGPDS